MDRKMVEEAALGLSRAIMVGDWKKVDALLDPEFSYIGDGNPVMGKAAYIGFMRDALCSAMTGMDMDFMRVLVDGNMVAVDYSNKMTNSGPFFGIPATGKRVIATGQFMRRVKDGKVVAEWQTTNMAGLMRQLTGK